MASRIARVRRSPIQKSPVPLGRLVVQRLDQFQIFFIVLGHDVQTYFMHFWSGPSEFDDAGQHDRRELSARLQDVDVFAFFAPSTQPRTIAAARELYDPRSGTDREIFRNNRNRTSPVLFFNYYRIRIAIDLSIEYGNADGNRLRPRLPN